MIDIAKIYRNYLGDAQPFNNFFKNKGYKRCRDHLVGKGVPMSDIVRRTSPSRGHPAVVLVHNLMGLEFIRWLDDSMYYRYMEQLITKQREGGSE